ncbi:twin-arginine translocase subunit TatC [Streptomyces morookaense]|uniref:Sec-independent protein translocase protein TatC n=1 Tax=Streptomyces morookaense TaxID=1970 RepID=A0A7Y7E6U4_STRMO|nr:twin-arginine translocase subunit TatC [Streptomyces morookaense]NVK78318.1 twin-arginine translocase subunit TatC [Streptomyces morookaense]GHF49352.1 Sec-independent protein translocase protein TatC [Streptomyces morookaense]
MANSARKKVKDPEGRMPLVEHLRELRNRLAKSVVAIVVVAVVAAFYYKDIIEVFKHPIQQAIGCQVSFSELSQKDATKTCGNITMSGLVGPFTLMVKVSLVSGLVLSSPVWLYQLWAFLAPGLHKTEKKYALGFVAAGVPLFAAGAYFAYWALPAAAKVLIDFTPSGVTNLLPLDELIDLVTRLVVVFGLSFELPLLLMMLNFGGILSGRRMLGWWRPMVMGVTVFAAVATPTVDPFSMFLLAGPIIVLYFIAVAIALVNDKRKQRANPDRDLDDDEAAPLDLTPQPIGDSEPLPALPEQSSTDGAHSTGRGYDDAT